MRFFLVALSFLISFAYMSTASYSFVGVGVSPVFVPAQSVLDQNEELTLPTSFPVTLQRNSSTYSIAETGADFLALYTGSIVYVDPAGSDANDGSTALLANQTILGAQTDASDLDVIQMAAGEYAAPTSSLTKDIAFTCPSGKCYIGTFYDLSTAVIAATAGDLYNVGKEQATSYQGFLRTDDIVTASVSGSAYALDNTIAINYQTDGIMSVFTAGGSSNFSVGTTEDLQDIVDAGNIRAWTIGSTQSVDIATGADVYFGENIIIASNATNVINTNGTAKLYLDGVEVYGGTGSVIDLNGTGQSIMFNSLVAGSRTDNIDYDDTVTAVESGVSSAWPAIAAADNATTAHSSSNILRVQGVYRGGSRTHHDVNATKSYSFSNTIGDARANDKTHMLAGYSTIGSESCTLDYGDITFIDTFSDGGLTNILIDTDCTAVNTDLGDAWPY